jgi:phospholipase A1
VNRSFRSAGAAALRVARLLTLLALTCSAARAEYILLPPPEAAVAGGPISLVLMIANDTDQPVEVDIPLRLDLRLTTDTGAFNTSLTADPPPAPGRIELAPGTFRKIRYSGELPDKVQGAVTLRVRDLETNTLMLAVSREPQQEPGTVIAAQPAIAAERPSSPFLSALSTYDPVYFALGTRGETNAKFQLSFKFQFFAQDAPLVRYANFLQDIYFGYTQTTIWNIGSASAPFYDTSYQPRVFYLNEDAWDWPGRKVMLGVESGLGHESNGKSGADSRSINIAYIKPIFTFGDRHDWHLRIEPMLIDYLQDNENPDIADYRGYVDLKVILGKEDSWQIQGLFRKGSQGFSTQIDLSYPLRAVALGNLNGYFLVQYFDGYGESILDYNRRLPSQLRLGLMVVR